MKWAKTLLWILGIAAVTLVANLDLNAMGQMNRVTLPIEIPVAKIAVDEPWVVPLDLERRTLFGEYEKVAIEKENCRLTMEPLDDQTARLAKFDDGKLTCGQAAILHLRFNVELLPAAGYEFFDGRKASWTQLVVVGDADTGRWRKLDMEAEPPHVRRHMEIVGTRESDGSGGVYFPFQPSDVESTADVSLIVDAAVRRRAGHTSLYFAYYKNTGNGNVEIPAPPVVRGSPKTCWYDGQWILAGGNVANDGYSVPQVVLGYNPEAQMWKELPTLPDETSYVEAVFVRDGKLAVYSPPRDEASDTWEPTTLFVLEEDGWAAGGTLEYDVPTGDIFPIEQGLLAIATQQQKTPVKLLVDGQLRTVAIKDGYSDFAPVTVVDGRVLMWRDEEVFELISWAGSTDARQ